jgi:hypothetical protein
MLLGWLRCIRIDVLDRQKVVIESDVKSGRVTLDELESFRHIEAALRGHLCDLEADVRRNATDFIGCITIRLRQIADRLQELSNQQELTAEAKKTCQQWKKELEEAAIRLVEAGDGVGEIVLASEVVRMLCQDVLGSNHLQLLAGRGSGFEIAKRLLHQVLDIAVCLQGMRKQYSLARDLIMAARSVVERVNGRLAPEIRNKILAFQVQCSFRLMGHALSQIYPWPQSEIDEDLLEIAWNEFGKGRDVLQMYPGWGNQEYGRYKCYLSTLGARVAYLRQDFHLAYLPR